MRDQSISPYSREYAIIMLHLPWSIINSLKELKKEWNLKTTGAVIERLLNELISTRNSLSLIAEEENDNI